MAKKPFTPSEAMVGRPLPKDASFRDQLLAGHIRDDGTTSGRMTPGERWLTAAHQDLRKSGLLRSGAGVGLEGGRPADIWYLTEKGLEEARSAKARVHAARSARNAWSQDFLNARRAAMAVARIPELDQIAEVDQDREPDPC